MTKEEILTLIKAGYNKADIDAMDGATTTPPGSVTPPSPAPTPPPDANVKTANGGSSQATTVGGMPFDYNEFAKAMAKAMAGMNTGNPNPSKTKEEEVNEALKGLFH